MAGDKAPRKPAMRCSFRTTEDIDSISTIFNMFNYSSLKLNLRLVQWSLHLLLTLAVNQTPTFLGIVSLREAA